jgi:hypothetical protein
MAKTENNLRERWMDLLGEDGFRPHLEANEQEPARCRIAFKSEGARYELYLDDRDPTFFNLSLAYVLGKHASAPDFAVLAAANDESRRAKATKVTVDLEERYATFSIEGFSEAPPSTEVFERMIGQCSSSADCFFKRLSESSRPVPLAS